MSDTRIEIVVSGENAQATMEQLTSQLPAGAEIVAESAAIPTLAELFVSGVHASAGLGQKVSDWFTGVEASGGLQPLATLAVCAVVFLCAYILERAATSLAFARQSRSAPQVRH